MVRRLFSSLPRVVKYANRSFTSLKIPGEFLDYAISPSLTHCIHVFHCPSWDCSKAIRLYCFKRWTHTCNRCFRARKKNVFYSRRSKWMKTSSSCQKCQCYEICCRVPVGDPKYKIAVLASKQVLSVKFLETYGKDIINIHHGLLPSFKGENPSKQVFDAGVKLIGETSHFVTEELDKGPIIEQMNSDKFVTILHDESVSHRDNLPSFVQKSEDLEK